mgnify:CR=1 FL=1
MTLDASVAMSEKEMLHRLRNLEQINEFLIRFLLELSSHIDAALEGGEPESDVSPLLIVRDRTSRLRQRIAPAS